MIRALPITIPEGLAKPTKGGKRAGAGRPRLSPDGALRKRRTITVTDAEYEYLREALEYLRTSTDLR